MYRLAFILMIACLWGGLFYAALSIAKLDLGYLPVICGPWGCLAGLAPLLSVHSMWLVLLGGTFTLARWASPRLHSRRIWIVGTAIGFCSVLGLWIFQYIGFASRDGQISSPEEVLKFLSFHTLRCTDVPFIEFLFSTSFHSLVPWRIARKDFDVSNASDA